MTRAETAELAERVAAILDDPDADLSTEARARWQGALTALEAVLGRPHSLGDRSGL